ncbi:MAG TPA: hypothetical protein VEC35_09280 [Noviherbaspirillum sp.]|nr:hypothetical protein [Noviherbaspirillum sp.]
MNQKNPCWFDLGVSQGQAVRTMPIDSIMTDADFVMSILVQISGIEITQEQKELATRIAQEEANRGKRILLDWIHTWNTVPMLCDFANALHDAAVRQDKLFR